MIMKTKKLKQILVLFLTAMLLLSGCNTGKKESAEASKEDKKIDTEKVVPISISMRTLALPAVENSPNINEDPYVKKLEELTKTDLDIRLVPHNEYKTKMDLMFASGDIPDVVQGSVNVTGSSAGLSMSQAVDAGVFMPLDDLINKYGPNLKKYIPKEVWDTQKGKDGKIYAIPQIMTNTSRRATFIRKDLLDKAGLEIPKTPEETLKVLRAFKKMGVEQPFVGRTGLKYADTFFGTYDVQALWELDKSGNPVPKYFDSANMKKAIQVYKTMYEEGLMNKEFLTQDANQAKNIVQSGKGGMWSMNANTLVAWEQILKQTVPDAEIAIIPSPVGSDGGSGYVKNNNVFRNYLINAEAENPERIIQFFDWMVTEEAEKFFTYGIEGTDYTVENEKINYKQPQSVDEVNKEVYRTTWLWMVSDATYTKGLLELTPEGKKLMNVFDNVLTKEGRGGISFDPELDTFKTMPTLIDKGPDGPSDFLMEHIAKMVTGAEPIDNWDNVIKEWKEKGGAQALEEAKTKYKEGQYTDTSK
jgi:putative aldouronate transport system substrate-binding protein